LLGVSSHAVAVAAANVFFLLIAIGLWRRWPLLLAYLVSLTGLGVIFRVGLPAERRHVGVMFMMIVFLYWRALVDSSQEKKEQPDARSSRLFYSLTVPLTLLMVLHLALGIRVATADIRYAQSSSKAFAALLQKPSYARAIVIGEPDYIVEALPYYSPNRLYYPHQARFATYSIFNSAKRPRLSLLELLAIADSLRAATGDQVLVALDPRVEATDSGAMGKVKQLTWSAPERVVFFARTRRIAAFYDALDERYSVYEVLPGLETVRAQ
jgi:succinate dehydrogenase/fumarate reductase cytochrome b subunit